MKIFLPLLIALVAACSAGPAVPPSGSSSPPTIPSSSPAATPDPTATPSPSPTAPPDARIIGQAGLFLDGEPFSVAAATNAEQLASLWAALDQQGQPPDVDFEREIALFLGMSGSSSCPERFERLVVDGPTAHVYAQWAEAPPNQPCTDDLQAQGVLIAVARDVLPSGQFRLTLREQLVCPDCARHTDQTIVDLGS